MAIKSYTSEGTTLWQVYVDIRSKKDRSIRVQRRVMGKKSEQEALAEEKKLYRILTQELVEKECQGITWGELVERWARHHELYQTDQYRKTTVLDYAALMRNWTKPWLSRTANTLNRGDGTQILRLTETEGKGATFRKKLKNTISAIYNWGISEKLVNGVSVSPVHGIEIKYDRDEKIPEILTKNEIRLLLKTAQEQSHDWYPVWLAAVLTGCRSGELYELRRSDLDLVDEAQALLEDSKPFEKRRYGFIRIRRSWNTRMQAVGPTKAGYWRNVPVSSEFYWFLVRELKTGSMGTDEYVLPHFHQWKKGMQAGVLRGFCAENGLPSVRFHTLRACFATQLISAGIPATVVMKICGWRDMKTMQFYIRLAGVDEGGATEVLKFVPTQEAVMEKVVNLLDFRRRSPGKRD